MTVFELIQIISTSCDPYADVYIDRDAGTFYKIREVLCEVDEDGTPRVRIRI